MNFCAHFFPELDEAGRKDVASIVVKQVLRYLPTIDTVAYIETIAKREAVRYIKDLKKRGGLPLAGIDDGGLSTTDANAYTKECVDAFLASQSKRDAKDCLEEGLRALSAADRNFLKKFLAFVVSHPGERKMRAAFAKSIHSTESSVNGKFHTIRKVSKRRKPPQ